MLVCARSALAPSSGTSGSQLRTPFHEVQRKSISTRAAVAPTPSLRIFFVAPIFSRGRRGSRTVWVAMHPGGFHHISNRPHARLHYASVMESITVSPISTSIHGPGRERTIAHLSTKAGFNSRSHKSPTISPAWPVRTHATGV